MAAQRQRNSRGGALPQQPGAAGPQSEPSQPGADNLAADADFVGENADFIAAVDLEADAAGPAVGLNAAGGVSPPEHWGDAHMNWRHPLFFAFMLNCPLVYFHPHPDCRTVCEFLKKVSSSGPQIGVRPVDRADNRRNQRRVVRDGERSESVDRQDDIVASLRESRDAMANAHTQANEIARLQLQLQVVQQQQSSSSSTSHLVAASTALEIIESRGLSLDHHQARKKKRMEKDLARACLEVRVNAPPDPYASIFAALGGASSALPAGPPVYDAASTVPRVSGGGSARPNANALNLHPNFNAAVR